MPGDIHLFTSNGGEAGKSLCLFTTLAYFVDKRRTEEKEKSDVILVFDGNEVNANVFENWIKIFHGWIQYTEFPLGVHGQDAVLQYYILCSNIYVIRLKQQEEVQIHPLDAFLYLLQNGVNIEGKINIDPVRITTALFDTHLSLSELLKGAHLPESKAINKVFAWILWLPYSLNSPDMRQQAKDAVKLLMDSFQTVESYHVFNPKLLREDTRDRAGGRGGFPNPLIRREDDNSNTITSYNRFWNIESDVSMSIDEFIELVQTRIASRPGVLGPLNEPTLYKIHSQIGKILLAGCAYQLEKDRQDRSSEESQRVEKKTFGPNPTHRYRNIFAIPVYDPNIANLKSGERTLTNLYQNALKHAQDDIRRGDCPILGLPQALGPFYTILKKYLSAYFPIERPVDR